MSSCFLFPLIYLIVFLLLLIISLVILIFYFLIVTFYLLHLSILFLSLSLSLFFISYLFYFFCRRDIGQSVQATIMPILLEISENFPLLTIQKIQS